jgi:futalosine hydrolase
MQILLVSATRNELAALPEQLDLGLNIHPDLHLSYLETGIGMMSSSMELSRYMLMQRPSLVIQAGIAGSFSKAHPPGSLAIVSEEIQGDLGVEENGLFRDIFDMGLTSPNAFPFQAKLLINPSKALLASAGLPLVRAITVNEVSTRPQRIEQLQQKYAPILESMEGAALHFICLREKIPFLQLRAVSNFVGERDKRKWQIKEAVQKLHNQLNSLLENPELLFRLHQQIAHT